MPEGTRTVLRPTADADLEFVLGLERHPDNSPTIRQWAREQHVDAIRRRDREHWIIESASTGDRLGYLISYDLAPDRCGVYVKRIVVADKGRGAGRAALTLFAKHAFSDLGAPYVWLCVYPDN